MPTLPRFIMTVIDPFAQAFWGMATWERAQEMVFGIAETIEALYAPAPSYSGKGRPRKKGARRSTRQQVLTHSETVWSRLTIAWYAPYYAQVVASIR